jgi:hypothetical protein
MKIDRGSVQVNQYSEYSDFSLGWDDVEGNRYHVWFDRTTRTRRDDTLYKNPPLGTPYKGEGYFHTRQLDLNKKANISAYTEALMVANDHKLFDKAEETIAAARAAEQRENEEAARIRRVKDRGVELLGALEQMVAVLENVAKQHSNDLWLGSEYKTAKNAIKNAKGE